MFNLVLFIIFWINLFINFYSHETVNINTLDKPEWIYEKNAQGKVPVLEYNGNFLNESDVIMRYVIGTMNKENELVTQDPMRKAKEELLIVDMNEVNIFKSLNKLHLFESFI